MIFGDQQSFAIEAIVEPGPEFEPTEGRNVVGRIRAWIGGVEVGRFEEPACWLGPPCAHLVEMRDRLETLWDPSFDRMDSEALFDRLDYLVFAAHRGRCLGDSWSDAEASLHEAETVGRRFGRFVFLLNSSESFDGWKAFLVRPTRDSLRALLRKGGDHFVMATAFPIEAFRSAVGEFSSWLAEQERLLLQGGLGEGSLEP